MILWQRFTPLPYSNLILFSFSFFLSISVIKKPTFIHNTKFLPFFFKHLFLKAKPQSSMGACLSKKKGSPISSSTTAPVVSELKNPSLSGVTVSKTKVETEPQVKLKKENKTLQENHASVQEGEGQVKKEIFIIKHRRSHDDRERNSKFPQQNAPQQPVTTTVETAESIGDKTAPPAATNMGVGVRTSSCTKEEVDAILIHCGRLSRSSSGNAVAASVERGRKYSGSKRSFDFDNCDNDTISTDEDQKKAIDERHQHRPRHRSQSSRPSSQERRRRTPSREREQQQGSSSRERRVSRSPGRRSSETTTIANARNNGSTSSRPGKMVSVPATVSSLVMDKSNNGCVGGGESAATTGIKRITVRRNVGVASPRSQSPARANGNAANSNKALNENQQQPSLSRNSSRKAEQSPYRRNPLSEIEPNSFALPQSTVNNNSNRVQNRPRKEFETEANQKQNGSKIALDKGVSVNCKTKLQQEEDVKVQCSMIDDIVVKTVVPPGIDNLKPHSLTRSRSSRRSRDLDLNPEALLNPPQSYASLLLEDIQNFHQKNPPSVSLPACVTKACSILEAVADLNSNTSLNFCGAEDRRKPPAFQSSKNEYNVPLSINDYGKRETDTEEPVVESMFVVDDDDVMEPSLHKYVTMNMGGVDMEDQESSGSNSFTVSSGQQHWGVSSSSWEPSSVDSKDCWTSRLNYSREEGLKSSLEGKKLNSKRRECDHQHGSGLRAWQAWCQ
ncbi:uncharacterized protein At1g65710-like [Abrus precatorius]|uniref:Uncharacterized protein At1g65710-like n=1 Tax=Abrus precatorius TaxID=3816 RepID=A0A8B8K257_ABRPR|nr:uncharacterized protein At1g65710-like [Abrus precatorius]